MRNKRSCRLVRAEQRCADRRGSAFAIQAHSSRTKACRHCLVDFGLLYRVIDGIGLPSPGPSCLTWSRLRFAEIIPLDFAEIRFGTGVVVRFILRTALVICV